MRNLRLAATLAVAACAYGQPATTGLYRLSTLTGGLPLGDGGAAANARLNYPEGVAVDASGNIYVADTGSHRIRRIAAGTNTITTIAGARTRGNAGDNGPALQATFDTPTRLLLDGASFLYVLDSGNHRIRRINLTSGIVEGFAGNGRRGFSGDGGPARDAQFNGMTSYTFDTRYFYIADTNNHRIRRIDRQTNVISTYAGSGIAGFAGDNGPAASAQLNAPTCVQIQQDGQVLIWDDGNGRLRRVDTNTATIRSLFSVDGFYITDMRLESTGRYVFVNDLFDNLVYRFDLQGNQDARIAGRIGFYGLDGDNGPANQANLNGPAQLVFEPSGTSLLLADTDNHRIRRIDLGNGRISSIAGSPAYGGDETSVSGSILFNPAGIATDSRGNLYISESGNCIIRRVDAVTQLMTRFAGIVNRCKSIPLDNIPARNATLAYPSAILFDAEDNLYVADTDNGRVRRIAPNGNITTVASGLNSPQGLALDFRSRTLYIADTGRHRVVALDLNSNTQYSLYAGNGTCDYAGDGGQGSRASLCLPTGVTVASNGALYIADTFNHVVRRVDPVSRIITTVAGTGQPLVGTNFANATDTPVAFPWDIDLDDRGNLFISSLNRILRLTPGGQIAVVAGPVSNEEGYADGVLATTGRLNFATNVRWARNGNVYFTDALNHYVRQLTPYRASSLTITGGNQQTIGLGLTTSPLAVQVRADGNRVAPNVDVEWAVQSGGATLVTRVTPTDADGFAQTTVRMPNAAGPVVVTATVPGLPVVTFTLTAAAGAGGGDGGGTSNSRPVISTAVSAGAFGGSRTIASGGWMEIFGSNLAATTRSWEGPDFDGPRAPVALDNVRVTVDGKNAFVAYISPTQVNVQVPDGIATGTVQVIVTNPFGTSLAFNVQSAARVPGLLAPASFRAGDRQYVGALFNDGVFVGPPGLLPGVAFRRAGPGDSVIFYAVGCGATNPVFPAGVVVAETANLQNVSVRFGERPGQIVFAGLAPGLIGLYQLNVVVPDGVTGDTALSFSVGGVASAQALTFAAR